jgi:hypothetical protein
MSLRAKKESGGLGSDLWSYCEHFVAQCLDVDVSSFGDSEDDALANLREALGLYFEDAPADAVVKVEGPAVRRLTLERA